MARRRLLALASVPLLSLAFAGLTMPSASAAPAVDSSALSTYLIDNLYQAEAYAPFGADSPDVGLTIDGELALAAAGAHDATLSRLADFIAGKVDYYGDPADASGSFNGGSVGKLALAAEAVGRDPHTFGGRDLIAALAAHVCTAAGPNCAAPGLYQGTESTAGQALAVLGAARGGAETPAAVSALRNVQCSDGSFPSALDPAPANDAACRAAGEVDSASLAAQALSLQSDAASTQAVAAALGWIAGQQQADGGFPGAAGDSTNSAALAIQALNLAPSTFTTQIAKARSFLAARQNSDGGLQVNADGGTSDVRASTQGLSGALGTPFSTLAHPLVAVGAAAPLPTAATNGARYLASGAVLTGGTHVESSYVDAGKTITFVDYGLTSDIAIALAATGSQDATLARVVGYLSQHVADYADPAGAAGGPYSGSAAKLALVAEITGQDPHGFGGTDLLTLLTNNVCTQADTGPFPACTAAGDFRQAFSGVSQALGVLALERSPAAGDHLTAQSPPVQRLLQLQCPDGGFSSDLPPASPCVSEVDTTGFAAQALSLVPDLGLAADGFTQPPSVAADALLRAQDYLLAHKQPGGSYPGAAGNNTNSTALAVQGLLGSPVGAPAAGTNGAAIAQALAYLAGTQNADGGFGINADATTSDARSSAQVVPSLELAQLSTLRHAVTAVIVPTPPPTTAPPTTARPTTAPTTTPPTTGPPASTSTSPAAVEPTTNDRAAVGALAGGNSGTGGSLPFTGLAVTALLLVAVGMLVIGAFAQALGRRGAHR